MESKLESTFEQSQDEWGRFMEACRNQTPLGEVLIVAAYIDDQLLRILSAFLVDGRVDKDLVSGPTALLGTFSSKTKFAYSMGLISKQEFDTINAIRGIRNQFAHDLRTSFDSPKVINKTSAFLWATGQEKIGDTDPYILFTLASQTLVMQLLNRADHVKTQQLQDRDWPQERTDFDPEYDPY